MQPKAKKYILDIESAIGEIEGLVRLCNNDFKDFENNPLAIRSLERLLEIVGEAVKKLLESDGSIEIKDSARIVSLRNRLAHAYDSIDFPVIWAIAIKNVPELKKELSKLG